MQSKKFTIVANHMNSILELRISLHHFKAKFLLVISIDTQQANEIKKRQQKIT